MGEDFRKGKQSNKTSSSLAPRVQNANRGNMKEEISMELAELGNMPPTREPMTPNQREKSEGEKWYG